uniref:Uncharacterized protein n=1 Tax=Palpitomonas bilix TaxID=652834 RepID=A0A7S3GBG1_9EUKA|eukprot:CAMPEP_0113905644 /NCGR_PEP_ID=MMETSP0780_2-20120614/24170_1 /TAXON_ID=652834 /ORGANISM="Palpitomonas bilix" /LENGTH=380 /DNA_ID=CAMNT_0000899883 /DNA_START=105 /DNA_END=1247 /DNA_ORIENTATION=- /assembly_acc=CAM_ASM_000599
MAAEKTVLVYDSDFKKAQASQPQALVDRIQKKRSRRSHNISAAAARKAQLLDSRKERANQTVKRALNVAEKVKKETAEKARSTLFQSEVRLIAASKKRHIQSAAIAARANKHNEEALQLRHYVKLRDDAIAHQKSLHLASKQALASINRQQFINDRLMKIAFYLAEIKVRAANARITRKEEQARLDTEIKYSADAASGRRDVILEHRSSHNVSPAKDARTIINAAGKTIGRLRLGIQIGDSLAKAEERRERSLRDITSNLARRHDYIRRRMRNRSEGDSEKITKAGHSLNERLRSAERRRMAHIQARKMQAQQEVLKVMNRADEEEKKKMEQAKRLRDNIHLNQQKASARRHHHLKTMQKNAKTMSDLIMKAAQERPITA